MKDASRNPRVAALAALIAVLFAGPRAVRPAAAAKKAAKSPTCSTEQTGADEVTTLSARTGGRPGFTFEQTRTVDSTTGHGATRTVVR
jgi:hypothetical protein